MTTLIEVRKGGLVPALCSALHLWGDHVEDGQLRLVPNPLNRTHYLVMVGTQIVATLAVLDAE